MEEAQLALAALAYLPGGGEEVRTLLRRLLRTSKRTLLRRQQTGLPTSSCSASDAWG